MGETHRVLAEKREEKKTNKKKRKGGGAGITVKFHPPEPYPGWRLCQLSWYVTSVQKTSPAEPVPRIPQSTQIRATKTIFPSSRKFLVKALFSGYQIFHRMNVSDFFQPDSYRQRLCLQIFRFSKENYFSKFDHVWPALYNHSVYSKLGTAFLKLLDCGSVV